MPIVIEMPRTMPAEILKVRQLVSPDDRAKQLVVMERNGVEYVLRPGARLTDETGRPISKWEDWTVGFLTQEVVLFTDGKSGVSVWVR